MFSYNSEVYEVTDRDGSYLSFVAFKVLQKENISGEWNWHKTMGQSETYDLKRTDIKGNLNERLQKVYDLKTIFFKTGIGANLLQDCEAFLKLAIAKN